MGSTFKAMGLIVQAFEFWWKALHIRPTFWDVLVRIWCGVVSWCLRNAPAGQYARGNPWIKPLGG